MNGCECGTLETIIFRCFSFLFLSLFVRFCLPSSWVYKCWSRAQSTEGCVGISRGVLDLCDLAIVLGLVHGLVRAPRVAAF